VLPARKSELAGYHSIKSLPTDRYDALKISLRIQNTVIAK